MDLGDGYRVMAISRWWKQVRQHYHTNLPQACPPLGLTCTYGAAWACQVALLDTDGPWMIAEYLCTNPSLPLRIRHEALSRLVPMIESTALSHGKRLMFHNTSKGVRRGLERMGVAFPSGIEILLGREVP